MGAYTVCSVSFASLCWNKQKNRIHTNNDGLTLPLLLFCFFVRFIGLDFVSIVLEHPLGEHDNAFK
jgi:hypothetical protein